MAPPLPEASQPSKTTHSGGPIALLADLAAEDEPQAEQVFERGVETLGGLLAGEPPRQVDLG